MNTPLLLAGVFGNLHVPELLFILVIVLIIFGPKSLPSLGRAMGKGLREFRDASSKFSEAIQDAGEEEGPKPTASKDRPRLEAEPRRETIAPAPPTSTVPATPATAPSEQSH
jgi:TatA/E family protein of Tat protein translocase